jgi:hypothetical protein
VQAILIRTCVCPAVECLLASTYPAQREASKVYVTLAMEAAGITFHQDHALGRLLRWKRQPDRVTEAGFMVTGLHVAFKPAP